MTIAFNKPLTYISDIFHIFCKTYGYVMFSHYIVQSDLRDAITFDYKLRNSELLYKMACEDRQIFLVYFIRTTGGSQWISCMAKLQFLGGWNLEFDKNGLSARKGNLKWNHSSTFKSDCYCKKTLADMHTYLPFFKSLNQNNNKKPWFKFNTKILNAIDPWHWITVKK